MHMILKLNQEMNVEYILRLLRVNFLHCVAFKQPKKNALVTFKDRLAERHTVDIDKHRLWALGLCSKQTKTELE